MSVEELRWAMRANQMRHFLQKEAALFDCLVRIGALRSVEVFAVATDGGDDASIVGVVEE